MAPANDMKMADTFICHLPQSHVVQSRSERARRIHVTSRSPTTAPPDCPYQWPATSKAVKGLKALWSLDQLEPEAIGFLGAHPCFFTTKIGLVENLGRWGLNESPAELVGQDCLFSVGTCWAVVCQTESPAESATF